MSLPWPCLEPGNATYCIILFDCIILVLLERIIGLLILPPDVIIDPLFIDTFVFPIIDGAIDALKPVPKFGTIGIIVHRYAQISLIRARFNTRSINTWVPEYREARSSTLPWMNQF